MATSAPPSAQRHSAIPVVVEVRRVFFCQEDMEIKVQAQWAEGDPTGFHILHTPTLTAAAFRRSPAVLLGSPAWAEFILSDSHGRWRQRCPAAFDMEAILGLRAGARDRDTLMEWDVARTDTYSSVANSPACPVCWRDFDGDTMVSQLPRRHVLCIKCAAMCARCPMRCN
jgi:hypothetical protein